MKSVKLSFWTDVNLVLICGLFGLVFAQDPCADKHGDLLPDPQDCGKFYQCVWGSGAHLICPAGLHFNPTIQVCDWPNHANCNAAAINATTVPPDNPEEVIETSTEFSEIVTTNNSTSVNSEPSTTEASEAENSTLTMTSIDTSSDTSESPDTTTISDIEESEISTTDISNSTSTDASDTEHPETDTTDDVVTMSDTSAAEDTETPSITTEPSEQETTTDISNPGETGYESDQSESGDGSGDSGDFERNCENAKHGDLTPDPIDCEHFYQCVWGRNVRMPCPRGLHFNPIVKVCDYPQDAECLAEIDYLPV